MKYKIISGKYETGTPTQKQSYCQLFGQGNTQHKFDLYFHWFNIIHEVGHCILQTYHIQMGPVDEELYVNKFAVAYWKSADRSNHLEELKDLITQVLKDIPTPVPEDMCFSDFFKTMWEKNEPPTVALYGYFQLSCVMEAMKTQSSLRDVLEEIRISIPGDKQIQPYHGQISSDHAQEVLKVCQNNLIHLGISLPPVELELVDNPEIQCASMS